MGWHLYFRFDSKFDRYEKCVAVRARFVSDSLVC